jgi:deazaflavin-dependent oxidoreductase (nitroreductase family)
VLALEVVGRKSGRPRTVSIIYLETSSGYLVTAANAGSDAVPQWWLNLRDAGEGTVEVGGRRRRVTPRLLAGAERERRWRELVAAYPSVGHYLRYTDREFPLVLLQT